MTQTPDPNEVFDECFTVLMELEGYKSNDKLDAGGLTKYGISQKAYPDLDIDSLTLEQARAIYYQDYFIASKAHELPPSLACNVFDSAVNMGVSRAIRFLQRTIGVDADGIFGKGTRAALERAIKYHGEGYVVLDYLSYRGAFYARLVSLKPTQFKFIRGWLRRTYRLQQYINSKSWS